MYAHTLRSNDTRFQFSRKGKSQTQKDLLNLSLKRKIMNGTAPEVSAYVVFQKWAEYLANEMLYDPQFWLSIAGYFITKYLTSNLVVNQLPSHLPTACTNLITFLLVFYVTSCYSRFKEQHDAVMKSAGNLMNICLCVRSSLSLAASCRILRYANAAHILSFVGLGLKFNLDNLFVPLNDKYQLLDTKEIETLSRHSFVGGTPFRVLLSWIIDCIQKEFEEGKTCAEEMQILLQLTIELRGSLTRVYHFMQQPVPFSYVMLVRIMTVWFLPFYAVSIGYSSQGNFNKGLGSSIIEYLYVVTYAVIVTSLCRLGQKLQNPLGDDIEDFDVIDIVSNVIDQTYKVLCAPTRPLKTDSEETALLEKVHGYKAETETVNKKECRVFVAKSNPPSSDISNSEQPPRTIRVCCS